jgi:hypothetical protein
VGRTYERALRLIYIAIQVYTWIFRVSSDLLNDGDATFGASTDDHYIVSFLELPSLQDSLSYRQFLMIGHFNVRSQPFT